MNSTISCPSCQRTLRVPESLLGQAVKCPSCSHTFTAPESIEEETPRRAAAAASERPSRRPAAPPPEDDYDDDEPLPSKRRLRSDDEDDEDYEDRPRRRRRVEKPGKVQAIAIMILVGGILACMKFLALDVWLGLATWGVCCVPATYSLVLGIMAIVKGSQLLGERGYRQPPPTGIGIMMIINIIALDLVNLTLGIIVLIFLSDPEVKAYYRG